MPAFPGTVRVAGTLSATDGAVIVTEDRLSLQAGEDNLGNWSLDMLDIAHKGDAITIAIDDEIVVFMTNDVDGLAHAVEEGVRLATQSAEERSRRIKQTRRPRIGRKATTKRKIELFDEHQREATADTAPSDASDQPEPGADPWLSEIPIEAPILNTPPEPAQVHEEASPAVRRKTRRSERRERLPLTPPKSWSRLGGLPRRTLAWMGAGLATVALAMLFPTVASTVALGLAAVIIMVAVAGMMDQIIELHLPSGLNVTRLFGLGLALLAVGAALGSMG